MKILGYDLVMTCGACPEQYDVFFEGEKVGYLRLRHGYFTATFPDVDGKFVYKSEKEGDGIFASHEREKFLEEAIKAIDEERNLTTAST